MKLAFKHTVLTFILFIVANLVAFPCTTVIISGEYTVDGRPLMLKQRDTPALENKVVTFSDGKYKYVGVVNTKDKDNKSVWGGHNSEGFSIMNSASYNINLESDEKLESSGQIMKKALQECATLADFERLLDSLPRPLNLSSNFGVIDAFGGAAYYETSNTGYVKFDVNDKGQAPLGYLIRTNFSFSGDRNRDKGLSRYNATTELLHYGSMTNNLSYEYLLKSVSNSLLHGITQVDLLNQNVPSSSLPQFAAFRDYIPRYLTASVILTQGVKKGESPALTTTWITLGFPLITPSIPVLLDDESLPAILSPDEDGKAKLNEWSLELKKDLFPIERGEGEDYINLSALLSFNKNGLYYQFQPISEKIFEQSEIYRNKWYASNKVNKTELREFYKWIDEYLTEIYTSNKKNN